MFGRVSYIFLLHVAKGHRKPSTGKVVGKRIKVTFTRLPRLARLLGSVGNAVPIFPDRSAEPTIQLYLAQASDERPTDWETGAHNSGAAVHAHPQLG